LPIKLIGILPASIDIYIDHFVHFEVTFYVFSTFIKIYIQIFCTLVTQIAKSNKKAGKT